MPESDAEYQRAAALEKQQRYPEAIEVYRTLAEQGHAKAALALAFIYLNSLHRGAIADMFGIGKDKDRALGQRYQLLAAQNGSSIAQWNIALDAFTAGDFVTARSWAARAADNPGEFTVGSMHSVGLLGWVYVNGKAGTSDRRHGIKLAGLYRAMCARDGQSPMSQFHLALDPAETIIGDAYAEAWYGMVAMRIRRPVAEPWTEPDAGDPAGSR